MSGTFTITCWGCNKSETHPVMAKGSELEAQILSMQSRGWQRRAFYPSSWNEGPWFCSPGCAYHSYNAKRAEEYQKNLVEDWDDEENQRNFLAYCREATVPFYFWLLTVLAALVAYFLGEYCGK